MKDKVWYDAKKDIIFITNGMYLESESGLYYYNATVYTAEGHYVESYQIELDSFMRDSNNIEYIGEF